MPDHAINSTEAFLSRARRTLISVGYYDPSADDFGLTNNVAGVGPNHHVMNSQMLATLMMTKVLSPEDRVSLARCLVRADPHASRLLDLWYRPTAAPQDPTEGLLTERLYQLSSKSPNFGAGTIYRGKDLLALSDWIIIRWVEEQTKLLQDQLLGHPDNPGLTGQELSSQRHTALLQHRTHQVAAA